MKNHTRYFIVSMLFFASSLNYGDRATVSLTKTNLSGSLGLDSVWMGYLSRRGAGRMSSRNSRRAGCSTASAPSASMARGFFSGRWPFS